MSDPLFKAVCVAGPSSEPCIHAGLRCTTCHPQIRYYRSVIQFPALSANRGKKDFNPALLYQLYIHLLFVWLRMSVIDEDLLLVTGYNLKKEKWEIQLSL